MDWNKLISPKRFGQEHKEYNDPLEIRSQFQRDYDRVIFSSPFRRLQNKTQVFPLPGRIFIHNRLTHSLEVASVGRSMANITAAHLKKAGGIGKEYLNELGSIVAAACLAHDLGNPPFGHSGEESISQFFRDGEGSIFKKEMSNEQWHDLTNFEGNANAFRLLTHTFNGRREGGFAMTYSTLSSIVKYPFDSINSPKGKKYGFFQSEKEYYEKIAAELGIEKLSDDKFIYPRHPLVYIVEAADDICYQIMDIEDAHKLKIITTDKARKLLLNYFDCDRYKGNMDRILRNMKQVTDTNEQIAYLRASVISVLTEECAGVFWDNSDAILRGDFEGTLIEKTDKNICEAYKDCSRLAYDKIYNAKPVVDIQIAGFKILGTLLKEFTSALVHQDRYYSRNILSLIPKQFMTDKTDMYSRIQSVVDHVSGMTDSYALDLYRTIKGIHLPEIN